MRTVITTIAASVVLLGGLAWAHMEPGMRSGMVQQQSSSPGPKAGDTHQRAMRGMGGMMSPGMMGTMMRHMMGTMMRGSMLGSGPGGDLPFLHRLLQQREQLGLSPEQVKQVQALAREARKAIIRHAAEVQVAEVDLRALMQADPVDLTQVEDTVNRLESQRANVRLAQLSAIAKARDLLTPEQRQQVSATAPPAQAMAGVMGCPMMAGTGGD